MEYDEEKNNVPGNIPEFGAIFMSNAETKRECFKRRVFALPSSKASFVKQVKAGMVLFLFEFEKRQLFGVYEATSDGALNILPHAFRSGGKQFPAQVCFTPIWLCSPLSENEFQSAIHKNYYSARKFKFGLSEDQVRRLLQLFSTRKLKDRLPGPPRQLSSSRFSGKGSGQIDHGRFAIREGLEMEQSNEDFIPTITNEYLENLDRGTELGDVRFYIEDRVEDKENVHSFGQGFLTDHAGDSRHKKRRICYEGLEIDKGASSLSFGTDNQEIPRDQERIQAASGRFLGVENIDDGHNIFNSLSSAIATKYSERPFDFKKGADYETPYSDGARRLAIVDDRFLTNDIMKTELGLHNARRHVISNKHDSCPFERARKTADDGEFLMNSKLGHKHHIDNGIAPVVPSESFETSLHRVRGTAGPRMFLMNERVISEQDPDSGLGISFLSGKVPNPLDAPQRKFDERRFPRDNLVKANYMEGLNGSATLNTSSGYDMRLERQMADDCGFGKTSSVDNAHIGTLPRPVISTRSSAFHQPCQSSLECFNKPFPDIQFPGFTTESQNLKASNSIFHDAIVTRSITCVSEVPSVHHERSVSFGAGQSATVMQASIAHHSVGNFLGLSKGKSFEADDSNRYTTSDFGNRVPFPNYHAYSHCLTDEICDGMDLKSPSADYKTFQFSPFTLDSVPCTKSHDFSTRNKPLALDGHRYVASQDMQKYIPRHIHDMQKYIPHQTNDEIYAGNELLSPYADLTEFDICHLEKDPINCRTEFSKGDRTDIINDNIQYYRSTESPCSDPKKHRRSVFTRLTSTPRLHAQEEQEEDADFCDALSVDEVMEMLHQNQHFWMKSLEKFNSLVIQHDEEEVERNDKTISFENCIEHSHSKNMSMKINKEANPTVEQSVDDKPKETRVVEFKRRRETKKTLDDKSLESNVIRKDNRVSGENKETKGPLDNKQGKRRKLVRPVFGNNKLVDGTNGN